MAHSSRRKRHKKKKHYVVVMELQEGHANRQQCPKCPAVIIDSPIPDRICWKCSPKESAKQLKAHAKPADKEEQPVQQEKTTEAYQKTADFLRKWHTDNGMRVPDCFENWTIYFFSRGSMLREWGRCMNYWMKEESCTPVTDMTPGKELERKIRERREATGATGPGFRTVEDKVANLRGDLERVSTGSQGRYSSQVHTPGRGIQQVSHNAPAIARPSGNGGAEFLVV